MSKREKKGKDDHPQQCAHVYPNGRRCPMPGSLSNDLGGGRSADSRPAWRCWWHHSNSRLGRDWQHEQRILEDDGGSILRAHRGPSAVVQAEVRQRVEDHPEWARGAGEGREEYRERMQAIHAGIQVKGL